MALVGGTKGEHGLSQNGKAAGCMRGRRKRKLYQTPDPHVPALCANKEATVFCQGHGAELLTRKLVLAQLLEGCVPHNGGTILQEKRRKVRLENEYESFGRRHAVRHYDVPCRLKECATCGR